MRYRDTAKAPARRRHAPRRGPARLLAVLALILTPLSGQTQGAELTLAAPQALLEGGLLQHLAPRFLFKTRHRLALVASGAGAEPALRLQPGPPGQPVFEGAGATWHLSHDGSAGAQAFADWLTSEAGQRALANFPPGGPPAFRPATARAAPAQAAAPEGDVRLGAELAEALCGRCHVTGPDSRLKGIGSTPSFRLMRALPRWQERFEMFYVLKPHGAFTRVAEVTPPFDPMRPPPIAPVELTLDELEAITAFAASLAPADLGAPLAHQ